VGTLAVVLGDQLDHDLPILREFDPARDVVLMMEVDAESTHVLSSKQRTCLFLSAMRHFAAELAERRGVRVRYVRLDDAENSHAFDTEIRRAVKELAPDRVRVVWPGEWRVVRCLESLRDGPAPLPIPLEIVEEEHFLTTRAQFNAWARGRKSLVMEHYYREQRRRLGVLIDADGNPEGGAWNFDADNRKAFKATPRVPAPLAFEPDAITREVMDLVRYRHARHPGRLDSFRWPVTRVHALAALEDFIEHRLPRFGVYEDAMWTGEPFLYHSLLAAPLNLGLLRPMECVERAVAAYRDGRAPIESVEGFVRQIIGWREFIRGVYWHEGPEYRDRNTLSQHGRLPGFYWTGKAEMRCVAECVGPVLEHGFGHHIPRLMVLGNLALLAGVAPAEVNDWFLAMYVDAVDWVTTPNVVGMSQHADGGVVGTKPYVSSGQYISRMSNFCEHCRYDVKQKTGPDACPFNILYWDFLIRHEHAFRLNHRMGVVMKGVRDMPSERRAQITREGRAIRERLGCPDAEAPPAVPPSQT
jgi:deoxyribodipyrimidine photolyase-related protein